MQKQADVKLEDLATWKLFNTTGKTVHRNKLLKRMSPLINKQVSKWKGSIPISVLKNEARVLTIKAFSSYDPNKGTALATHVVNNLAPLSRIVYTHQNVARLPENITLKVQAFQQAKEYLSSISGREPTSDELHQELGWSMAEINRVSKSGVRDLVESVGGVHSSFYSNQEDSEADLLAALYFDLSPSEKRLFEMTTGYNNHKKLSNPEIMKKLNQSQAQLSYNKTTLTKKLSNFMKGSRR